jgi:hypothetical protein
VKLGRYKLFEKREIGPADNPLLIRWALFRTPSFGIWIHKLCRSDYERAQHDHPFGFVSIILKNGYKEVTDGGILTHKPGSILVRPAEWKHRVVIDGKPSWNLLFVGRRRRRWGFFPDGKWCWWRQYNLDSGICEEEIIHFDNKD